MEVKPSQEPRSHHSGGFACKDGLEREHIQEAHPRREFYQIVLLRTKHTQGILDPPELGSFQRFLLLRERQQG